MADTYINPVYNRPFADPFVLKFCGEYWGYSTGKWKDGRFFGILRSRDLVNWEEMGGALEPLPEGHPYYWAPEVHYHNGRFYLYYSVGDEVNMELRVALAEHPAGPFKDSGKRLTTEQFAIDAHVFIDDDGTPYLFYATDFLEHTHIGTGTVRDKMRDPLTLEQHPQPVTLPRYDWHVYDPHRVEKGGVRWHTVEGPFVLKRKGRYYQMFSGGNWHNVSYGVSYGVTGNINAPGEWEQAADGTTILPIIRTIPGKVIGPGHNSVVRGPDNRQLYCVYHRWADNGSARVMAIDPLDWAGDRMLVLGPSTTPQPLPNLPTAHGFPGEGEDLGPGWEITGGTWERREGVATQTSKALFAQALYHNKVSSFLLEIDLKGLPGRADGGSFGIGLQQGSTDLFRFLLMPDRNVVSVSWQETGGRVQKFLKLPEDFDHLVYHHLWVEVEENYVNLQLDKAGFEWEGALLMAPVDTVALFSEANPAAFCGFTITNGWEELFTRGPGGPWLEPEGPGKWLEENQELHNRAGEKAELLARGPLLDSYELVVNARLISEEGGGYGFYPALAETGRGPLFRLEKSGEGWILALEGGGQQKTMPLPAAFDPFIYQQFRFRKANAKLKVAWEEHDLGEIEMPGENTRTGLFNRQAHSAFEMVRVTELTGDQNRQIFN